MEIYTKISEEKYPKVSVATIGKLQENFAGTQNGCEIDYYQKVLFCRPNYNGFKHL